MEAAKERPTAYRYIERHLILALAGYVRVKNWGNTLGGCGFDNTIPEAQGLGGSDMITCENYC